MGDSFEGQAGMIALAYVVGCGMRIGEDSLTLLRGLQMELRDHTDGFAESYGVDRAYVLSQLMQPLDGTVIPLKDFIRDQMRAGWVLIGEELQSPNGLHAVSLSTIGTEYARYLRDRV